MIKKILIISILAIILISCKNDNTDIEIKPYSVEFYFHESINPKEQFSYIKNYLSFSEGVCAIPLIDRWIIKPIQNVNFQEISNLWVFSEDSIIVVVKRLQTGSHLLTLYNQSDTSNAISLHGQLSEIQISDINNDGTSDILLGISKKVHFDPTLKKRINIYSYQNHNLQPLWLGTKFIYDIEEFDVKRIENFNYLITLEIDNYGNRFQGIYEWDDFGFALKEINKI